MSSLMEDVRSKRESGSEEVRKREEGMGGLFKRSRGWKKHSVSGWM